MGDIHSNVVIIANGKGGVGKTSLSANIAGLAALSGWRTLLVDLDPQGNLGTDLGYWADAEVDDQGLGMLEAATGGRIPAVVTVRPNLDVVPGGRYTEDLSALLQARRASDPAALFCVRDAIQRCVDAEPDGYHLVMIDTPPAVGVLVDAAFAAGDYLIVPTRGDPASLNGIQITAERFARVRTDLNPGLEVLGIALFGLGANDTRIIASTRQQLARDLGAAGPLVFKTFIRDSRKSGIDTRARGLLAYEYEEAAAEADPFWKTLQRMDRRDDFPSNPPSFSRSASGLAQDYQFLTTEILQAITDRQEALI